MLHKDYFFASTYPSAVRSEDGSFWRGLTIILDRTRRAWVAPARDGRYVLGQLRSRTAGVNLRSILDGIVKHYLNDQEIEKSRLFWGPGKSFLFSDSSVFFGTLKID